MKIKIVKYLLAVGALLPSIAHAAVWQWSVAVRDSRDKKENARAYLWIPPGCRKVKAFLYAQNNMEEQSILENPKFRKEMAKLGIAEVWVSPASDLFFRFNEGAGEVFTGVMNDLADVSGYQELSKAPFIGLGHSAAASNPYYMAAWDPQRALAAISVSGQWPYFRANPFAPDIWGAKNIDFIPSLETMGEYESASGWSAEGLKERQQHPSMPLSMLACPAEFHFASSDDKVIYIALFIKKALQYRLPDRSPEGEAPMLTPIDPVHTGWLADKWRLNQPPTADPAPVNDYQGDPAQAFWFFDGEIAKATADYEARYRNQNAELIGFEEAGKIIPQHNVHQQFNLTFHPLADGITFYVHATFYDTVPGGSPRPAGWAQKPVGSQIGHSGNKAAISIDRITGPFIKLDDTTFQVHPQMGFWESPHSYELWFSASHPGGEGYKPAVQQGLMAIPPRNSKGKEQHITFNAIPDQRYGQKPIRLAATSDAGVPVGFYIQEGPAEIKGGQLKLTEIPPRSRFPIKITVVAWQYGNSSEPKLQTAIPVTRSFWISK